VLYPHSSFLAEAIGKGRTFVIEVQKQIKAQFHVQMIVLKSLMFFIYEILLAKKQEQRQVQIVIGSKNLMLVIQSWSRY